MAEKMRFEGLPALTDKQKEEAQKLRGALETAINTVAGWSPHPMTPREILLDAILARTYAAGVARLLIEKKIATEEEIGEAFLQQTLDHLNGFQAEISGRTGMMGSPRLS